MTKDDVISVMQGKMHALQFFYLYCIDLGHTPERVQQLVAALQQTVNMEFVSNLMQYVVKVSQNRFEIVTLINPKQPTFFKIL